jgi:hypothetical protein
MFFCMNPLICIARPMISILSWPSTIRALLLFAFTAMAVSLQSNKVSHYPLRLRGGIFDPWELSRMLDINPEGNVTADIVEDWTLEKERALWNESEQELERHWQRQRWGVPCSRCPVTSARRPFMINSSATARIL